MAAPTLPADTVWLYNDGLEPPTTPVLLEAERAYRSAYLAAAREVASWDTPHDASIEHAWRARREARRKAQVRVAYSKLFGDAKLKGKRIVYRSGHEIEASRTRGRCHALELAAQVWRRLNDADVSDEEIAAATIRPWVTAVETWAATEIEPDNLSVPPGPDEFVTEGQRHMLESPKPAPPQAGNLWQLPKPSAITRRLSAVERETLQWLWPGRIPLGKLTLLAGDPGLGKSFVTLDIAARVSSGEPWPDLPLLKQTPASVLLFNAEDDLADTIAPRLDKAGADDRNIVAVEGVALGDQRRHFSLEQDLPRLEEVLEQVPETRLIVIDPISAYTGKIDSHKNADVRGMLAPLAELAGRHRLAIVAVTHLSKSGGSKAVYRAMGSLAFAAASRAVWAVAKDPNDPQRRLFLPGKLNLARDPEGLAYRIEDGRVAWEAEPVRVHADEAFAAELKAAQGKDKRGTERREAMEWLREQLKDGPCPASDLIELGEQYGFTKRTLQRALKEIGGARKKDSFGGPWLWSLPDEGANEGDSNPPSP